MPSHVAMLFYVIASICGWVGYGLGISSLSGNAWMGGNSNHSDLFKECINDVCNYIEAPPPWLNAVRALMIIMLLLSPSANIINIVSVCNFSKTLRQFAGLMFFLAGLCGVIATSVYTSNNSIYHYGVGYIFAWICGSLQFIAGIINFLSSLNMDDDSYTKPEDDL